MKPQSIASTPKRRRKGKAPRRSAPKRRSRPKHRSRPKRRRIVWRPPTRRTVVDELVRVFSPSRPYDEQEAAMDALSGKEPCRHGRWPHEGGLCALCAAEVAVKVCAQLFGSDK